MATYSSQAIPGVRESTREGSGGEDDNEEILDPRVKVSNRSQDYACASEINNVVNCGKFRSKITCAKPPFVMLITKLLVSFFSFKPKH